MSADPQHIDILLYIALNEEFGAAMELLGEGFQPRELKDVALTSFVGSIPSPALGREVSVAVIPAGKMGNTRAANVASAIIAKLSPANVVVLGIAGSLSNDLEPGDVFIPGNVNEYLANAAATGDGSSWMFETSGNEFQTSMRLLDRFQLFEHTHKTQYSQWQRHTAQHKASLIEESMETMLRASGLPWRGKCRLFVGNDLKLASGPAVGKGKAFLDWLTREVDRKASAMEMESAGVYDAALIRTPAPRTMAIRGISDYADERKKKIENAAKGRFRELAAKNAVSLLIRAIEGGLFRSDGVPSVEISHAGTTIVPSSVRSAFVIGGVTEETNDKEGELPRLHHASLKLGKLLASAGTQLIVCSPFPDSADYYVVMGYAEGNARGVIHMHSPSHPKVAEKRDLLVRALGRAGLMFQDWLYPGPESEDSWTQAWLLAQLQALERADLIVALGGKISKSANTLLHLAEARGIPVVPFAFLGGAAKRSYERRDWQRLHPGLDATVLERSDGIEHTIEIANRLILDRVARTLSASQAPKTAFVSFARKDAEIGKAAIAALKQHGLKVLIGDEQIRDDQMAGVSIEQAVLKSDVCIVLWSQNYALSPWCYDELSLAVERHTRGQMRLWLFNLDDSVVVPRQARKLAAISVRNPAGMVRALEALLAGGEENA